MVSLLWVPAMKYHLHEMVLAKPTPATCTSHYFVSVPHFLTPQVHAGAEGSSFTAFFIRIAPSAL